MDSQTNTWDAAIQHRDSREEDVAAMIELRGGECDGDAAEILGIEPPEDEDEAIDAAADFEAGFVLSVDKRIVYDVTLSYGGPTDGLELTCDETGDLLHVEYYTTAPGTMTRVPVHVGSALYRWAEDIAEMHA